MAEDWVDVPAATPPHQDDGWESVPAAGEKTGEPAGPSPPLSGPNGWTTAGRELVNSTPTGGIMKAFGEGFGEAWGPDRLGLSKDSTEWLAKKGIFASGSKFENPFQAFNEGVMVPAAAALDAAARLPGALYRGAQAAGVEAGLHRDIVSIPDAFLGSPGGLGEVSVRPGLAPDTVRASIPFDTKLPAEAPEAPAAAVTAARPSLKLELEDQPQSIKDLHNFNIMGPDGPVAHAAVDFKAFNEKGEPTSAKIIDIFTPDFVPTPETPEALQAAVENARNALGPREMRDVLRQFREMYPSVQEVTGNRISGARLGGGLDDTASNSIRIALPEARDLGLIGPERTSITEGTPEKAADQAVSRAADGPKGEKITQEIKGEDDPWKQRFNQFVGKLDAPGDVQQLIRDSAKENGDFMPARQGQIPLSQLEDMATAAGVDTSEVSRRGLGRLLQNDNEVRTAMQLMLQVTDDVKSAARDVKADGSPENLIKFQQSIMRRDMAVEQVVGLRAEWGRTGGVFQEFMRDVKDQQGLSSFLKGKGRSPADLADIAHTLDGLDPGQAGRFLNDLRTPSGWDKAKWYWVNSLISGPVTHTKYAIANTAFGAYESGIVTPVAGAIGAARRAVTGGNEGVFLGEGPARLWGMVAGTPDALMAAVKAAKTGMQTPLPGEVAQGIIPKQNKNVAFQQRTPDALLTSILPPEAAKTLAKIVGVPSRGASAIHSFFNFLGYRASVEAQAYRQAAKEGLKPVDDAFWQRRASVADRPTPEMMNNAIEEGYRLTYITELGETGRKLSAFVNSTKLGQLVMPFTHIPLNIMKRALEGTPAAFLDAETRAELAGTKGAVKQDTAIARMVAGTAVGTWAINLALNDRLTGFGPTDQKERSQWLATGHQPYAVRIGDEWYSFSRFGSMGTMLSLYANLAEVIPHLKPDGEELTKAIGMTVHSTGRLMEDEVGMQGLAGLMDAINEPDRKGARFVANFAGSWLPMSSFQRQVASAMDPYMRETKSVVDGLRYYIPNQRQGLQVKRDWLGAPMANAGYGGDAPVPGVSALIQHRNAVPDPVSTEMAALDLRPAPPQNRIRGVKLTPDLYDTYQATAGPFLHQTLSAYINAPGWHELPTSVRQEVVRNAIKVSRTSSAAAMQMAHPELIQQAVKDRVDRINGVKPTKLIQP